MAAPLKSGFCSGEPPHAQVILQLVGELLHPLTDPDKFNSLYLKKNPIISRVRGILLHLNAVLKSDFFSPTCVILNMITFPVQ